MNSPTATWGINGTLTRNVAWRTSFTCIKGDHHTVENNLAFDQNVYSGSSADGPPGPALEVMMYDPSKSWSIKGENSHTKMHCNGADWIFNVSGALPGDAGLPASNNSGGPGLPPGGVRSQLVSAEAQVAEAVASHALAMSTVQRQNTLLEKGHVAQQRVDEAVAHAATAQARIDAARAQAETLRVQIDLARIAAPYAGVITSRMFDEGAIAAPGAPVFELVETGVLEARIGLRGFLRDPRRDTGGWRLG